MEAVQVLSLTQGITSVGLVKQKWIIWHLERRKKGGWFLGAEGEIVGGGGGGGGEIVA